MPQIDYGTSGSENIPLSQQNFGAKRNNLNDMPPPPAPVYVEGLGMLGPDIGGYAKGVQMRQDFLAKGNEDARAEEALGLAKEKFGQDQDYLKIAQADLGIRLKDSDIRAQTFANTQEDRMKEQVLDANMQAAAKDGGYEGVVNYLKVADPAKAVAFHIQKLQLDDAILKNDVMQAVAPAEKAKAMMESYGVLGKMFSAVLKTPADQRQGLLDNMQPILQKILGERAPKTLEQALPMGLLAVAQATPENQLFKANTGVEKMQSNIGQINADILSLQAQGYSDPEKSPALKSLMAARDTYESKYQASMLNNVDTELSIASKMQQTAASKQQQTENLQKNLMSASKDFIGFMDMATGIQAQLNVLQKDPTNAASQGILGTMMASAVQKGVLTDQDFARTTASVSGWKALLDKNLESWKSGKPVVLTPEEVGNLKDVYLQTSKIKMDKQKVIEGGFDEKKEMYKQSILPDAIKYPSSQFENQEKKAQVQQVIETNKLGDLPPEIQMQAADAIINKGWSIEQVRARLQEVSQKNGQ